MKTDLASAAMAMRIALEHIMRAKTLTEARAHAAKALSIKFDRPEEGKLTIASGWGHNTQTAYVAIGLSNPTESANPFIQLEASQARAIGLEMIEASIEAEQDGFMITFVTDKIEAPLDQAGAMLQEFRLWREERGKK